MKKYLNNLSHFDCEIAVKRLKKVLQCYSVYDSIIAETKHSLRGTCRKEF